MKTAPCLMIVYFNKACSYHYVKDVQSCGAAMQNMQLTAYEMDIGSCCIGDLLEKATALNGVDDSFELMGVVFWGYDRGNTIKVGRKDIEFMI